MSSNTKLFDNIAKAYGKFFNIQVNKYKKIIDRVSSDFDISNYKTALDVGCGTGALSKALSQHGLKVTGVDPSIGMLEEAEKRVKDKEIKFINNSPGEKLPFPDGTFDIVISSYVAHGLDLEDRIDLYREMQRVSKEYVIIYDYNENRSLIITIIEWLENGDYFNFIKIAEEELETVFDEVKVIDVAKRAAWYICK